MTNENVSVSRRVKLCYVNKARVLLAYPNVQNSNKYSVFFLPISIKSAHKKDIRDRIRTATLILSAMISNTAVLGKDR